jgi:ABC-2 type transport system permease protein
LKTLISNSGSKKKHVDMEKVVKCKKRSVVSELLKKEWLIIKRTPSFMLNIVVIIFLMPIIFISSFAIGLSSGGADTLGLSPEMVNGYLDNSVAYLIVLVVCAFFTSFSVAASTSISREGSNAWVMKAIPVSAFKQVNVKVLFASILDFIGVVIAAIIPVVMFEIPLYYVACVLVPITLIIFILNYFNIYLDLKKPKIRWSEDVVAVKQNMNALFSILFTFAVSAILGIAAYFIYDYKININVVVLSGIITFVCVIILTLIICAFKANEKNLLKNVD